MPDSKIVIARNAKIKVPRLSCTVDSLFLSVCTAMRHYVVGTRCEVDMSGFRDGAITNKPLP